MKRIIPLLLLVSGCTSVGPGTVPRDRFEYSTGVADSWKQQMLLNIVKLRYMDPPIFVDVGQIVSGYTVESTVGASGTIAQRAPDLLGLSGALKFTDRPTITYTPLTGNAFMRGMMTPLLPESLFFLIQSGWAADTLMLSSVMSINGLKNRTGLGAAQAGDDDFFLFARLFREVQLGGALGMRIQKKDKDQSTILFFRKDTAEPELLEKVKKLQSLLKIQEDLKEFKLVYGPVALDNTEIAVQTRSIFHTMAEMAVRVEVPAQDVTDGRATPGVTDATGTAPGTPLLRIHHSTGRPSEAAVSVPYRGLWFYIDDRDLLSKKALAFLMILFTIADTGSKEPLPLLTISTQ